MSEPQNIIELVKELQTKPCDCQFGNEWCDSCLEKAGTFEPIAESLLIAVEALEKIDDANYLKQIDKMENESVVGEGNLPEEKIHSLFHDIRWRVEEHEQSAYEALQKIHSLPTS